MTLVTAFRRPQRYRLGDAPNTWANPVNACAAKLDALADQMTPEVAEAVREAFAEFGQMCRDYNGIIDSLMR
jgi:hypothetical protein